ncbi:MAG: class I mannose-6-phosphate isomerase [Gemmatimonadetes bacterium]|jgi:mannose-6-phosphate isomerase|nr:class I mannose-6-phosphate isomerase [Gemmatimonadota bacterium]MBT6149786.1 class I mannose-6-phosphate isomerase [Gemmatimonadota bacterium]MBT7859112.1 class I mannose-6-phosphate isomerase [Gemmatimonadota bacterium]
MSTNTLPDVLPLRPYLREMIWGGRRLGELYGKPLPDDQRIGESFEVSALPERDSVVASGPLAGRGLAQLLTEYGSQLVGDAVTARYGADFPLLIKLIDAQDDLSIQVHPDDAYAREHQLGVFGKTEAWVILQSEGARIALGLEDGVDQTSLSTAIATGTAEQAVCFQTVSPGDVVNLPAGTVHALCRGLVIYEVQQSSDITFRLYDYNRPGLDGNKRELHVDHGLAVTDFEARPQPVKHITSPGRTRLIDAEYFCLDLIEDAPGQIDATHTFAAVTVVAGEVTIEAGDTPCTLGIGDSALIPAGRTLKADPAPTGGRCLVATPSI